MSLILDALNKADNERDPEATPTLNSNHDQSYNSLEPEKDQRPLFIAGAVAGVLILVFIIWLFSGEESETQKQLQVSNATSAAPSNPGSQANITSQPSAPKVNNRNQQVAPTYTNQAPAENQNPAIAAPTQRQEQTTTQQYEQAPPKKNKPAVSTKNKSQIAAIYSQPEETVAPKPTPKPTAPPKFPSLADYGTLSFIGDLPYSKQKNIPTLMYTDHRYQRGSAGVTINKVDRRKGDQIASGLVLEDIVEDGIVLNYQSKLRFKMVAFNSWINM